MFRRMWCLLVVLVAGMAAPAVRAQEEPVQPYVVLVGIDTYNDPQIKPRKHAERDALGLYDLFVAKEHLGVSPKHIKLLLGTPDEKRPSQAASRENILQALTWATKAAGKDDLVVFAYIGQGAPIGERSCYFAANSTFKNRAKDAVASGDIEHILDNLHTERFVAFVDVNFLGFDPGKEPTPDPNLQNFYREYLGNEEIKGASTSRAVFLANSGLKPSLDLDQHGVFTQVLIDGLQGKADRDGYEPDGNITVGELAKYVRKELPLRAKAQGKTDEQKIQTPLVLEGQTNDFIIDWNPAVHPKAADRLVKFGRLAQEKKLDRKIAEEGANLLTRMPKLEAQQNLRKVYQELADGKLEPAAFQEKRQAILDTTLLSERDANNFAIMVLRAAKTVRQGFVKEVNQGTLIDYAVRGLFRQLNEKMPSAVKDRLDNVKALKEADLIKLLTEARQHLGKREDLDNGKDITFALHGMLGKLDKHTDYIDPEALARTKVDIEGIFTGIGVQIRKNHLKDQLQVVTPIMNSPAYNAKIYANDIITTIIREVDSEGKPLDQPEVISTKGMSTEDAVKKILGKKGTKVKLVIEREGEAKPLEFNLIRGQVEVESVAGAKRNGDDTWSYVVDPENKICYVRLTGFAKNTTRDLEKVMRQLAKAGIKGFILDLRFNPGGLLDQAVKISDLFIDDGLIVTIRPRNGPETSYVGKSDGSYTAFPMVCLVNGHSASASEIVSACLQDHGRAIIVGSRSYGKGSVQTIHPFDTGGLLKLTTATFWRPSNRNLNKSSTQGRDEDEWGVSPNQGFDLKLSTKELNDLQDHLRDTEIIRSPGSKAPETHATFRDRQLDMALEYLRGQIRTASKANGKKTS